MSSDPPARQAPRQGMVLLLGLLTLVFFGLGGIMLIIYQERALLQVIMGDGDIAFQILLGVVSGVLIGMIAWWVIRRPFMDRMRIRYATMIGPIMQHRSHRIMISICAGVGEELFFRGAVQFWLGILLTAILFVAIHGYLDPRNWRISIYGAVMTLAMIAIGWMAWRFGLIAPMLAHTIIDVILLEKLATEWRRSARIGKEDQS